MCLHVRTAIFSRHDDRCVGVQRAVAANARAPNGNTLGRATRMTTVDEYSVVLPEAARLADLVGIKADMEKVVAYASRMIERWCGPQLAKSPFDIVCFTTPLDFLEWEALSTATAVAYARCFATGVRGRLPPVDDLLGDPDLKVTHSFLVEFRNKHAAHSVNAFEENEVADHVGSNFASSGEIEAVTPRHTRQSGFSLDLPSRALRLAEW
jgi:hypothetical protein